jgi:hypothetical protein
MMTFLNLWENMQNQQDQPLSSSGGSSLAMQAVRAGMEFRGGTFWDDFLKLCRNSEGVAELFDVKPDQVVGWSARIGEMRDQVQQEDNLANANQKNVISTGSPQNSPY